MKVQTFPTSSPTLGSHIILWEEDYFSTYSPEKPGEEVSEWISGFALIGKVVEVTGLEIVLEISAPGGASHQDSIKTCPGGSLSWVELMRSR
jgi:hypothetical protein